MKDLKNNKFIIWCKNHALIFVVILFILLSFKSCQSCSKNRQIDYIENMNELKIDSLRNIINSKNDTISYLYNENDKLQHINDSKDGIINEQKRNIKFLDKDNNRLNKDNEILKQNINNNDSLNKQRK